MKCRNKYIVLLGICLLISIHGMAEIEPKVAFKVETSHPGGVVQVAQVDKFDFLLTAVPNTTEGYVFQSWEDGTTENPRTYTHTDALDEVYKTRAIFVKTSCLQQPRGVANVALKSNDGPVFTLTTTANPGSKFYSWSNADQTAALDYSESMGDIIPVFVSDPGGIAAKVLSSAGGTVRTSFPSGTTCKYEAVADTLNGYKFLFWSDNTTTNPKTITLTSSDADTKVYAVFGNEHDLIRSGGHTTVTLVNAESKQYTLAAIADTECDASFKQWSNASTNTSIAYTESDGSCYPIFDRGDNTLVDDITEAVGGTIDVTPLECGFRLTAKPNPGYGFIKWHDGNYPAVREVEYVDTYTYSADFGSYVAQIGTEKFATITEAISKSAGEKVYVIDNTSEDVVVSNHVTLVGQNHSVGSLTINCGASVTFEGKLTAPNLYIHAQNGSSAQMFQYADNLEFTNSYLDFHLEPNANQAVPLKWYSLSVPFEVNVANGIQQASGLGSHSSGTDYLVWEYDGTLRKNTGNGWKHLLSGTMVPGKFYMIGIDNCTDNVWRFKNATTTLGGVSEVTISEFGGSTDSKDGGWNALGNTFVQYAKASISGIDYCQVYVNAESRYAVKEFESTQFTVACPFFVQTNSDKSMTLSSSLGASTTFSPIRKGIRSDVAKYRISLTGNNSSDDLYVTAEENAPIEYTVGRDVAKIFGEMKYPYLWIKAYNSKLCAHNLSLLNGMADCMLTVFVPRDGTYTIQSTASEYPIYLVNEELDSDLSVPNTMYLTKGEHLFTIRIGNEERTLPTNLGKSAASMSPNKYILDGILYIENSGRMYNAQGMLIK